jgi:hypothetical protein
LKDAIDGMTDHKRLDRHLRNWNEMCLHKDRVGSLGIHENNEEHWRQVDRSGALAFCLLIS